MIYSNRNKTRLTCWISVRYLAVLSDILNYSQTLRGLNLICFVLAFLLVCRLRLLCSVTVCDSSAITLPPLISTSPWSPSSPSVAAERRCQSWSSASTRISEHGSVRYEVGPGFWDANFTARHAGVRLGRLCPAMPASPAALLEGLAFGPKKI